MLEASFSMSELGYEYVTPIVGIPIDYSEGLQAFADTFVSLAQGNCPVRTGYLRSSIHCSVGSYGASATAEAPYAQYVEYGTWKMSAQPYFESAVESAIQKAMFLFEQARIISYEIEHTILSDLLAVLLEKYDYYEVAYMEVEDEIQLNEAAIEATKAQIEEIEARIIEVEMLISELEAELASSDDVFTQMAIEIHIMMLEALIDTLEANIEACEYQIYTYEILNQMLEELLIEYADQLGILTHEIDIVKGGLIASEAESHSVRGATPTTYII